MMDNIFAEYRKKRKLTQKELADILNIDQTTVSKWENSTRYPHTPQLLMIQEILHIPNKQLLDGLREIESERMKNSERD